jgi:hypothetical protein
MDLQARLDILIGLAQEAGLTIRREPLGGDGGGFCLIKGQRVLFIDTQADLETRYERTLQALAWLPELEQRYVPPEVRDDLERQRAHT